MKNEDLYKLFENRDFDLAEPPENHRDRFSEKLKKHQAPAKSGKLRLMMTPLLAVAAMFLFIFVITEFSPAGNTLTKSGDLAGISPEMKETHQFYSTLIKTELAKVNAAKTPETEAIANDAIAQLEKLDKEYEKLKKDLVDSGQDKRVIFAMVSNLQQRIDLLNHVLTRIENIKELKNPNNENNVI